MAYLRGIFSSEFRDEPLIWEDAEYDDDVFFHHDTNDGSLILGNSLGDNHGADIYWFKKLDKDLELAFKKAVPLFRPQNIYQHIMPWGRSGEIPTYLDNGEPAKLTIVHLPLVRINFIREEDFTEL